MDFDTLRSIAERHLLRSFVHARSVRTIHIRTAYLAGAWVHTVDCVVSMSFAAAYSSPGGVRMEVRVTRDGEILSVERKSPRDSQTQRNRDGRGAAPRRQLRRY